MESSVLHSLMAQAVFLLLAAFLAACGPDSPPTPTQPSNGAYGGPPRIVSGPFLAYLSPGPASTSCLTVDRIGRAPARALIKTPARSRYFRPQKPPPRRVVELPMNFGPQNCGFLAVAHGKNTNYLGVWTAYEF